MTYTTTPRISLVKVVPASGQIVDHEETLTFDADTLDDKYIGELTTVAGRPFPVGVPVGLMTYETDSFTNSVADGQAWSPINASRYGTDKTAQSGVSLASGAVVDPPFDGGGGDGVLWQWITSAKLGFLVAGYYFLSYNLRIDEQGTNGGKRIVSFIRTDSADVELERVQRRFSLKDLSGPFTMNLSTYIQVTAPGQRLVVELFQDTNAAAVTTDNSFNTSIVDIAYIRPPMGFGVL